MKFWYFDFSGLLFFSCYKYNWKKFHHILMITCLFSLKAMMTVYFSLFFISIYFLAITCFHLYVAPDRISWILQDTGVHQLLHLGMSSFKGWGLHIVLPSWDSENSEIWQTQGVVSLKVFKSFLFFQISLFAMHCIICFFFLYQVLDYASKSF